VTYNQVECDVLVLGTGAAGLTLALQLADQYQVALIAKGEMTEGCTVYAQGGISAVAQQDDSLASHIEDTLNAGAGLCDEEAVRTAVENGPRAINWLLEQGVSFTKEAQEDGSSDYHLTREGGHSHRRVYHAADATGKEIETSLAEQVRVHPNITIYQHHIAVDLIRGDRIGWSAGRCVGAYVLDKTEQYVKVFNARCTILATGGASKAYLYTSNPDVSTGDGIAMAWRAGCRVGNMEFVQFHPTCLYHSKAKSFLVTEAVRGEGGRLLLPDGTPFMKDFDPRAELAPRDIVARAIDHVMKRDGLDHVLLDISYKPAEFVTSHFPTIYQRCLEFGFDMTKQALPVVPAAHYTCGGVKTDLNGCTDLDGLYAIGETAFTGLHGANRMASNSLLECIVFAFRAADHIREHINDMPKAPELPAWDESRVTDSDEEVVVSHNWDEVRRFMWDYVGIVRTDKRLQRAKHRVDLLKREAQEYYGNFRVTNDLIELRNLVHVADLIILSAMSRKESRGLHYTLDYPERDDSKPPQNTILIPENYVGKR